MLDKSSYLGLLYDGLEFACGRLGCDNGHVGGSVIGGGARSRRRVGVHRGL